jgi:acetylornithine deacetylase
MEGRASYVPTLPNPGVGNLQTAISFTEPAARAVQILEDLVKFDTVSSQSNLAMMAYIEDILSSHGITSILNYNSDRTKANLFATIGPLEEGGVILSGHTDVVPVADQQWSSDPFILAHRGDRIYGRGTADMKAFIACSLAALEFIEIGALVRPVYLAFSYDEEVGCLGAPALIEDLCSKVPPPAAVIVGEPSKMRLIGSHKSVHLYEVSVTGVPAHSSAAHLGISANAIAVRLMAVLLQIADALMENDAGNQAFHPPFSTLTIGLMKGGTAANVLAPEASFVFDLRCLPEQVPDEILSPFYSMISVLSESYPAATITVENRAAVPGFAHITGGAAEALVRSVGGDNSEMLAASFGSEAGQFQRAGFSTLICGPGSIDQAHQADEFIEAVEIEKCMDFMRSLFQAMRQA